MKGRKEEEEGRSGGEEGRRGGEEEGGKEGRKGMKVMMENVTGVKMRKREL